MAINYPWSPVYTATPYTSSGTGPYMPPYGANQSAPSTIVWVSGETGAKNYPTAPNTSILLMDSESSRFYVKSADVLGVQTIRSYEYNEIIPTTKSVEPEKVTVEEAKPIDTPKVDYVSRKEFDELKKTIDELIS